MSETKMLKVVGVGPIEKAKDGRSYRTVNFVIVQLFAGMVVEGNKILARNFWEKGPQQKTADGTLIADSYGKGDHFFKTAKEGSILPARYLRKETTPYSITEGKPLVNSYATIVLEEEDEKSVFNRAGLQSGFTVVETTKVGSNDEALKKALNEMPI